MCGDAVMSHHPKTTIIKDKSKAHGYRIEIDGVDITNVVTQIEWFYEAHSMIRPNITLTLAIVEAEVLDGKATWVGLENVPTGALQEELDFRK